MLDSFVEQDKVDTLNEKIYERGVVDREHLMEFLTYVKTTDDKIIISEVNKWLQSLHNDPKFNKVSFPKGDIDAVISDLDSYGKVSGETILQFKQNSNKTLPLS